jgi:phosphoribosylaminoimidazolecarboxamide formyltransferase/IMP cyclohydrolase
VLSVYDKTGIVEFARGLSELGYQIVSTGGTARKLREAGVEVTGVSDVTGFPEIMGGRVKTLHPVIAGGILARRDNKSDMKELAKQKIEPIDVVAVNLYPFEETIAKPDVTLGDALEQIDIGGPTMLREAAKNHPDVTVICDPADYDDALAKLKASDVDLEWRRRLAVKVFRHTSGYDSAISHYLSKGAGEFPPDFSIRLQKIQDLRYGENPDQAAAFYRIADTPKSRGIASLVQHHGKELSYNNILDLDGALMSVAPFARSQRPACAVIKHTTPCGIAAGDTVLQAYQRALSTDPTSAFGSVIAFTHELDGEAAESLAELFVECVVAPGFSDAAMERLTAKKNLRILSYPDDVAAYLADRGHLEGNLELRGVPGAALLRFAWAAIWGVKSNAILLARDEMAIGIGAGQMSRVDASRLAGFKAQEAGHSPEKGCVLASDAFFPFRDGVDTAVQAGVKAIVEPGGSIRDQEIIAAADEHKLAMVFTGRRLFRH